MRLEDRTIVVTGASMGLGRAMADAFVAEGARVVYSARSSDRLRTAVEEATRTAPGEATAIPADVRDWDAVCALVDGTLDRYGPIDVLVNNAGVMQNRIQSDGGERPVHELPVESWDTIIQTNLGGAFRCTRAALPGMLERDAGRVLHVSSGHGVAGRANRAAYVASKFGLEGFHETLALELAATGLSSVALRPPGGGVYTEGAGAAGLTPADFTYEDPAVIAETAVRLAAGEGENGGRYKAVEGGEGYVEYSMGERA